MRDARRGALARPGSPFGVRASRARAGGGLVGEVQGEGQESDAAAAQEAERVEVGAVAQQAPVQAGAPPAVHRRRGQDAQGVARRDRVAPGERGLHRQVGGAQAVVHHADQRCPADAAREVHVAGSGRAHPRARLGGQVHAQVSRQPALLRRVEPAQHADGRVHRPAPGAVGDRGSGEVEGEQQERDEQQGGEAGRCHASRVDAVGGVRQGVRGPVDDGPEGPARSERAAQVLCAPDGG
ncbi:hypothetical protein GCM10026982_25590 [Nocardiopsis aegyptia]